MTARSLIALAACMACLPAAALFTRADRDDAEYLELATRYASSIRLPAPAGEGVLVGSRWILTAAAPARQLRDTKPAPRIAIAGQDYEVQAIHFDVEVALILLSKPVRGVPPVALYQRRDEAGKGLAIVAHGETGRIGGTASHDGKRRAGLNTVSAVSARSLEVRIRSGDDASDLQGALAPGEAGAGAYIVDDDDRIYVAGVALSTNGAYEIYARVSTRLKWLEETILEEATREAEALLGSGLN